MTFTLSTIMIIERQHFPELLASQDTLYRLKLDSEVERVASKELSTRILEPHVYAKWEQPYLL